MNLKMNCNGYFYFEMKLTTHTHWRLTTLFTSEKKNVCGNQKKNNFN